MGRITVNGTTFTSPGPIDFGVTHIPGVRDEFSVDATYPAGGGASGFGRIALDLTDPTATSFGSTDLPPSLPLTLLAQQNNQVIENEFATIPFAIDTLTRPSAGPGTPAVPEPSTLALLGVGGLALAAWRRRRGRTQG